MHVYAHLCSPKGALFKHKCILCKGYAEVAPKSWPSDGTRVFFLVWFFVVNTKPGCQVSELPFPAPTAKNKTRLPPEHRTATKNGHPPKQQKKTPTPPPLRPNSKEQTFPCPNSKNTYMHPPKQQKKCTHPHHPRPKMRGACGFCCLSAGVFCFMLFGPLGGGHVKAQTAKQKISETHTHTHQKKKKNRQQKTGLTAVRLFRCTTTLSEKQQCATTASRSGEGPCVLHRSAQRISTNCIRPGFMQPLCGGYALMHVHPRLCSPNSAPLHKCILSRGYAKVM